jgi:hypothetical protein
MRLPQPLPARAEVQLTRLLDQVETKADYRRVLCVWLRAALGWSAPEIARTLGWAMSSVYNLHSRYRHEGATALLSAGRGGRHHALLSEEQEKRLLASFAAPTKNKWDIRSPRAPSIVYWPARVGANSPAARLIPMSAERRRGHSKKAPPFGPRRNHTPSATWPNAAPPV